MPATRLFVTENQHAWFGIQRFDRHQEQRIHMHSLGGLVDADFRLPSLDYIDILKITQRLTRNMQDVERNFAVMVFNVLAHNQDDHSKNFAYLMDETGEWRFSPAYDLTCSNGVNGEHTTSIAGEGKSPSEQHLLHVGASVGLKKKPCKTSSHVIVHPLPNGTNGVTWLVLRVKIVLFHLNFKPSRG